MEGFLKAWGHKDIDFTHEKEQEMRFVGFVDLHSGHHIVAEKDGFISVVKAQENTEKWFMNEPIKISKGEKGLIIERDILGQSKAETLDVLSQKTGMPARDVTFEDSADVSYIGSVHLKEGVFAAVSHDDHVSLVKFKDYPIYEPGQILEISTGNDGFAEVKEANRQQELELEAVKEAEKGEDKDIDIDW